MKTELQQMIPVFWRVALVILFLQIFVPPPTQAGSIDTQLLASKSKKSLNAWKSIEIKYEAEYDWVGEGRLPDFPKTYHSKNLFVQSSTGKLYFDRLIVNDGGSEIRERYYADGVRFANWFTSNGQRKGDEMRINSFFGMENTGRKERPEMLKYQYVGLKPLYDFISHKPELRELEWLNHKCSVFQFSNVNGKNDELIHEFWADQESGWVLRYFLFNNDVDRGALRPSMEWAATSFDLIEGRKIPLNSTIYQYDTKSQDNAVQVKLNFHCDFQGVQFDRQYPDSMFWPAVNKNTTVWDMTKKFQKKRSVNFTEPDKDTNQPKIVAEEPVSFSLRLSKLFVLVGLSSLLFALAKFFSRQA